MNTLIELLRSLPLAALMLVVTLGFLLGRLRWRGLTLGAAGSTLLVATLAGAAGLTLDDLYGDAHPTLTLGSLGFSLFIYSVGFEAGPRFFDSFRGGKALSFTGLATLVNLLGVGTAVLCGTLLGFSPAVTAGLLAGALTSAPSYAAAVEIAQSEAELTVSFIVTYPIGLVMVVLMVGLLPRLMGDDLAHGAAEEEDSHGALPRSPELRRVFEVENPEVIGRSLAELGLTRRTGCTLTRLHRGHHFEVPSAETRLEQGDHLMAKGRLDELKRLEGLLGPEVFDDELRSRLPSPRAVHVAAREVIGKSLAELDLVRRHHSLLTEVVRGGVALEPAADLRLARDDIVLVVGRRDDVRSVARELGRFERSTQETDLAIYAGGIFLGLLLGTLSLAPLGIDLTLGAAPGLLAVGVLLGRFRRIGPFSAHVPVAARQLVRDLGILLFVAETGVRAGGTPAPALEGAVLPLLLAGLVTTLVPVLGALAAGSYWLKLRPLDSWGSICGGMTSSAALNALRNAADSNEPAISYAASYAVASVLATLAGRVVIFLM